MRSKSTELMNKIVLCIDNYFSHNGSVPTMQQIADSLKISKSTVSNYVAYMKKTGMIKRESGWHCIKTKTMSKTLNSVQNIPVVGSIACGTPILADENIEKYLPIPNEFLGRGKYFILKASGSSMVNAGINDGDYVIVRQQKTAEQGQIVIALIDNEATLKRYYLDTEKRQVRLHPENDNMQDMYFNNIVIQGIAVKIVKDLY